MTARQPSPAGHPYPTSRADAPSTDPKVLAMKTTCWVCGRDGMDLTDAIGGRRCADRAACEALQPAYLASLHAVPCSAEVETTSSMNQNVLNMLRVVGEVLNWTAREAPYQADADARFPWWRSMQAAQLAVLDSRDSAELDSPNFTPGALRELEARGFVRVNVPRRESPLKTSDGNASKAPKADELPSLATTPARGSEEAGISFGDHYASTLFGEGEPKRETPKAGAAHGVGCPCGACAAQTRALADEAWVTRFFDGSLYEEDAADELRSIIRDVRRETVEACAKVCDEFEIEQASHVGTPSETTTDLPMAHAARMLAKKLRQQAAPRTGEARHPYQRGQVVEILVGKRAGQRYPVLEVYLAYRDDERPGVSIHDEDTELFYGLDEVREVLWTAEEIARVKKAADEIGRDLGLDWAGDSVGPAKEGAER